MAKQGYGGKITLEQFCFFETRIVARLMCEGKSEEEIIEEVVADNLFQYPTERTLKRVARACYMRMQLLNDDKLVDIVAHKSIEAAKQICIYANMKMYPLVWDFMVNLIGEKYRVFDLSFGVIDINEFFEDLKRRNDEVADWSESTVAKLKQVLKKMLAEGEYLDSIKSERLNPIFIESELESAIRANGDENMLVAFNCLN